MSITAIPSQGSSPRVLELATSDEVLDHIAEICEAGEVSMGLFDGLEGALVGWTVPCPGRELVAVYDWDLMVGVLVARDGMEEGEAEEFLDFNTVGAWFGETTPVIIRIPRRGV